MKKVLALGASNSSTSINKKFATYVANQLDSVEVIVVDLNDFELPLYGPDLEARIGIPKAAQEFNDLLGNVDAIVLSLAEYNGNYTTAFKNIFDWISRIDMKTIFKNKPMFLLATSPGGRGAKNVLDISKNLFPHFGGNIIADYSLANFHQNFSQDGITDSGKREELNRKIGLFQNQL